MHRRMLVYHTPDHHGGSYRIVRDPSIGDVRSGREKGAIVLRRVIECRHGRLYGAWLTDDNKEVVVWEGPV